MDGHAEHVNGKTIVAKRFTQKCIITSIRVDIRYFLLQLAHLKGYTIKNGCKNCQLPKTK